MGKVLKKKSVDSKIYAIYAVNWTEYERGWGSRPDGTTYHSSKEVAEKYVKDYNERHNNEDTVPDCYSQGGKPYLVEVEKKIYDEVMKKGTLCK